MNPQETAEAMMDALERGDFETAGSYMADDFQFSSHTQPPRSKQEWLGMSMALKQGFPDLSYNFQVHGVEGNMVQASSALSGTHTADLDLTPLGMGVIPATGISVSTGRVHSEGVVNDDGMIQSIHVHDSPESGVAALLAAIGVQPPM